MKLTGKSLGLIAFLSSCFCNCTYSQQNLALHKNYQFSEQPNYKLSTNVADKTELTDGLSADVNSVFWTQQSTVGWQGRDFIEITFDLGKVQPIASVSFSTAQAEGSDVYFPNGVYIFLSNDNQHFYYQGKLTLGNTSKAARGDLRGIFQISGINKSARYIALCAYPQGKFRYLFCDEVKINKSANGSVLKGANYLQKQIKGFTDGLRQQASGDGVLPDLNLELSGSQPSQSQIQKAKKLKSDFQSPFVVQSSGAWGKISTQYFPSAALSNLNSSQLVLAGGSMYEAFTVTNAENTPQVYSFQSANSQLHFYKVNNIGNEKGFYIADPLILVFKTDTLMPGQSQLYMVSANNIQHSGQWGLEINSNSSSIKGNVSVQVINKPAPKPLDAVNWGYLNYPMLKGIEAEAVSDMQQHHINTFVVPPSVVPNINATDLKGFKGYLSYLPKDSKVFLYMDYTKANNKQGQQRVPFLSAQWKSAFLLWYGKIMTTVKSMGFKESNIYLYPYDEIKNPNDIQDFKQMITWLKSASPGAQIFATILNKAAADALYDYLDIAQFYIGTGLADKYQNNHTQKWTYAILGASRSLPSYQSYRLMAWQAYRNNVSGIGFWNYAGNKSKTFVSSTFQNYPNDYTVIYNSASGGIISSRRWEAFKLGLEDYQVIKLYEQYFGKASTLSLVNAVLNSPNDNNKAEQVKQEMLQKLKS